MGAGEACGNYAESSTAHQGGIAAADENCPAIDDEGRINGYHRSCP